MLSVLGYSTWSDFSIFGMQILDLFDFTTNNIMMPVLALLTCILIGYAVKTKYIEEEVMYGEKHFRSRLLYSVMIKYICPICMAMILITPFVTEI
jgi:NSS family neurotransmitter:Na+ symporter